MTLLQFRVVLMSYTRRPLIWLLILVYGAWCCFCGFSVKLNRSGMTGVLGYRHGHSTLNSTGVSIGFFVDSESKWDRLSLSDTSPGSWTVEQLRQGKIPKTVTRLDISELLSTPAARAEISGQTEWPEDDSPAGEKLRTYIENILDRLSLLPRLTHVALPPLRLTDRFADLLLKLPPIDTLVITGTACLPESWSKLA